MRINSGYIDTEIDANFAKTSQSRIMETVPRKYRLIKKKSGETILQGAFYWWEDKDGGFEWLDIPTEIED